MYYYATLSWKNKSPDGRVLSWTHFYWTTNTILGESVASFSTK